MYVAVLEIYRVLYILKDVQIEQLQALQAGLHIKLSRIVKRFYVLCHLRAVYITVLPVKYPSIVLQCTLREKIKQLHARLSLGALHVVG